MFSEIWTGKSMAGCCAGRLREAVREQNIKKGGVGDVWLENFQSRGHARWY